MGKKSKQKQQRRASAPQPKVAPVTSLERTSTVLGERLTKRDTSTVLTSDYGYVRSDIRRILILLAGVVAILAGTVVVGRQTSWLREGGTVIAQFLELQ